ncbi:GNAT family N-acetyltransferase [Streptomyces litchfieldiae]|uniref:GNAT family N-acetyltransferase n=1 Tax=Streptomyces litchfieldiae TaxID=3075543 RepID=A0ABU2MKY9_9ACTN|nr:GNAT family N-acetyltransferase [Streptomyces sp. DSM 44938]MDT0342150.1 GNAT family N-acetyltransferase [Streptomyces sp. DSM 44938]
MGRLLVPLTPDNFSDLPSRCRACVFWELDPVAAEKAERTGQSVLEKESWLSTLLLRWGSCGRVAYVDEQPAGFVLYAPPAYVPRSGAFPTSPVSADAVQLLTGWISPGFQGQGLGRVLMQTTAKDLLARGVRAIEVFGDARSSDTASCLLPTGYLLAVGFEVVRPHPVFPRLRLELKRTVSWRADMELALDRLLGSARPITALRPS